jgi:hypothetical protein
MTAMFRILCVSIILLWACSAQAASTNILQISAELQDGSRVIGRSGDDKIKFHSEILGEISLPLNSIASIESQPKTTQVKLATSEGDILSVRFAVKEIHLETSFGKVNLAVDSIRHLTVSKIGPSVNARDGVVALWSADGDARDRIGNCDGQLINGARFAPGKVGRPSV